MPRAPASPPRGAAHGTTVAALVVVNSGGHVMDLRTGELVGAVSGRLVPKVLATTIGVIAIDPVHTMFDGDTIFTPATGARPAPDPLAFHGLLTVAARVVTRAIVRGVLSAEGSETPAGRSRSYPEAFPSAVRRR